MNFEEYSCINKKVSSEMFTFLMLTLYNVLPLTQNVKRLIKYDFKNVATSKDMLADYKFMKEYSIKEYPV